jgi:hypothetical protein
MRDWYKYLFSTSQVRENLLKCSLSSSDKTGDKCAEAQHNLS